MTAILGPRQFGKTTLARTLAADSYFDLENPQDLACLEQPQLALEDMTGLIVIDEIQRLPDLFPLLRYLVDHGKSRRFVILGSASQGLIRQSSESLAERTAYLQLGGFRLSDIDSGAIKTLWWRVGLPPSFLAASDCDAFVHKGGDMGAIKNDSHPRQVFFNRRVESGAHIHGNCFEVGGFSPQHFEKRNDILLTKGSLGHLKAPQRLH